MKTIFTFTIMLAGIFCNAQDTLDCKKDLSYDKKEQFFYKKGDDAQKPVTGPAVCYPKKGQVNKGKLVNGKWDGAVKGYSSETGTLVGKAQYRNGVLNGPKICYTETGKLKDSLVYDEGTLLYARYAKFDKEGNRTQLTESDEKQHTSTCYHYGNVDKREYISEVHRMKGGKKDGIQEKMGYEAEAGGSIFTFTEVEDLYRDGDQVKRTYYDHGVKYRIDDYADGKPAMENTISADGRVAASYPLKGGKRHGSAIIYDGKGGSSKQEYSRGKLVTPKVK